MEKKAANGKVKVGWRATKKRKVWGGEGREGKGKVDDGLRASSISRVALLPEVTKGSRSRPRY